MIFDQLKAYGWILAAIAAGALASAQTWRLHSLQAGHGTLLASVATDRTARATAWAADSDKTAGKEQVHAASTQKASDVFTQAAPGRETALLADLQRARSLLNSADSRATRYRAQADAGAAACGALADRTQALDRQLAEGLGVVADLRGIVERRDAEVVLMGSVIDTDRALLAP